MITADEELDLVDVSDVKIGVINRSRVSSLVVGGGRYVRVSDVFIRNAKGEFWIPRRTADKRIAPGGLDFSMGEHVGAGESYLDAAIRGFHEELNMEISREDLRLVAIVGPRANLPFFEALYLYETDETPKYNSQDFTEAHWMKPKEVIKQIEDGDLAKANLVTVLRLFELLGFCS